MKYLQLIIFCFFVKIVSAQTAAVTIDGSHTLTQTDGVGLYEAIDLCLKKAIINGVFEYLDTENNFEDDEKPGIIEMLEMAVDQCVMEPRIIEQALDGDAIYIRARGEVDPMVLYGILGLE
tara:strand:+ start:967 stop:1329 length:363 start_codon:yes stop_codon:yes gene_type:complete